MSHTIFARIILSWLLITSSLILCNCSTSSNKTNPAVPKNTSYYPYMASDQYEYFHRKNLIGLVPPTLDIPPHQIGVLEYSLNADSWWGTWHTEVVYTNYFLAEHAKNILGCGPLPEGTIFTIKPGIYEYKKQQISFAVPFIWQLNSNLPTICATKTHLDTDFFEHDSIFWQMPHSKDRISSL